jgi:hypothetical protein
MVQSSVLLQSDDDGESLAHCLWKKELNLTLIKIALDKRANSFQNFKMRISFEAKFQVMKSR